MQLLLVNLQWSMYISFSFSTHSEFLLAAKCVYMRLHLFYCSIFNVKTMECLWVPSNHGEVPCSHCLSRLSMMLLTASCNKFIDFLIFSFLKFKLVKELWAIDTKLVKHAVGKPFMFFTQTNRSRCNNKQLPNFEYDFGNSWGSLPECIFLLKYKLFNNDGLQACIGVEFIIHIYRFNIFSIFQLINSE